MNGELITWGFSTYARLLDYALPVAIAFGVANLCVNTFLTVCFGGKLKIGGKVQ